MGNAVSKDPVDNTTGMSKHDVKLVRDSWRRFCQKNSDYGMALFMAMFSSHPEYLALFPSFKNVPLRDLPDHAKFRAHTLKVGQHLAAFIDSLDDTDALLELVRTNAVNHLSRPGVYPRHFEGFFSATMQEMIATNKSAMTPTTIIAWEKLFEALNMITRSVYDEAATLSPAGKKESHDNRKSSAKEPASSGNSPKGHRSLSPPNTRHKDSVSPLAIQSTIRGSRSNRKSFKPDTKLKDCSPNRIGRP